MKQEDLPVKPYATNYGVLYGIYSILILVLLYAFNYETNALISILNFIITAGIVWYAIHIYKIENNGQLDLSTAIKMGLAIGVVGGLIYGFYTYLHYEFIQPEEITELRNTAEADIEAKIEQQQMKGEDAENIRNMSNIVASPFALGTLALLSIIFKTFLVGLVVGMIKRNN